MIKCQNNSHAVLQKGFKRVTGSDDSSNCHSCNDSVTAMTILKTTHRWYRLRYIDIFNHLTLELDEELSSCCADTIPHCASFDKQFDDCIIG